MAIGITNNAKFLPTHIFARLLEPNAGPIAGLEISDSHLRFFSVHRGKIAALGLRLPPGIIQRGRLADREGFKKALSAVREQLKIKEKIYVILSIPSEASYLQVFNLPFLSGENLRNAIELNLEMISPVPFASAYASAEVIGETGSGEGQLEVLGIFSERENIDALTFLCREANFIVVAVEPSILPLVRALTRFGGVTITEPSIVLEASDIGMDFAEVKANRVYFNYFVPWRALYGDAREVSKEKFEETVTQYIQKILTFAAGHGAANVKTVYLVTSALADTLKNFIAKNFKLNVVVVAFQEFKGFGPDWGPALGAYERGLLPRSEDTLPSLMGVSTAEEFRRSQILAFIELWRNVAVVYFFFLALALAGTYFFLNGRVLMRDVSGVGDALRPEEAKELGALQKEASDFNALVALVASAREDAVPIALYLDTLIQKTPENITLERVYFQSVSVPVLISGTGTNEKAVIDFKNALSNEPTFTNVQLPIGSLVALEDGRASFSITFVVSSSKAP